MKTTVTHKHVKNYKATIERVFVGRWLGESIYITFDYTTGKYLRASRWTGLNEKLNDVKAADLRSYNIYESRYRIITKSATIAFIPNRKELFQTLDDLGYNRPLKK